MQKRAVQFTKKPYLPLFSSETADKFAKDYAIIKSFRHALHLVTAHLHRQNQVAHALRTRDFWLASLSMHFPIHFGRRAHEYPVTLSCLHVGKYSRLLLHSFTMSSCAVPSRYVYCPKCFSEIPGDTITVGDDPMTATVVRKSAFREMKNDAIDYEP